MRCIWLLCVLSAGLSVGQALDYRALNQFRAMILCMMPDSWPVMDYTDYGCYCGMGGSGEPVDGLDSCCQVHDKCYSASMEHPDCWLIFDNPYTELYSYSCDADKKQVTCSNRNDQCEMFICECDRKAAECFARNPWNPEHEHLPSDRCE